MAMGASNVDTNKQVGSCDELINLSALDAAKGFPLCQLRDWGWVWERGTYTLGHPPIRLSPVASTRWFSFLSVQVSLVCCGFVFVYPPWEWQ
jgi:hypothetical protein